MSIRGKAFIAGAYEHPGRTLPDRTIPQIHADIAVGALQDAGLTLKDVDGFFTDAMGLGMGVVSMSEYLGLKLSYMDSTESGGSSYLCHVGHAAAAIAAGKCKVALVSLAGKGRGGPTRYSEAPELGFEAPYGPVTVAWYALAAQRHMYEFGTTSEQLAEIKVAASHHAQYNPDAFLKKKVTVEDVLNSPLVADPLHRLDSCVITDGGGAVVLVSPEVARDLPRQKVKILGHGESPKHTNNGRIDLTYTGAVWSGPRAFEEAGVSHSDIDYASIYDSFTITVLLQIEDLGFCEKGKGGQFVSDGALLSPNGKLPFNTDGGGLCNNHPANRGGMTKILEAVRQLRGEARPEVQVPDCEIALAHGTGGSIGSRMGSSTLILGPGGRVTETLPGTLPAPSPQVNLETQRFWDATTEGKLLLPRCKACGLVIWYPREFCPECNSFDVDWFEASGRGTIYSYTVNRRGQGDYRDLSYVLAYVELEEGPRVLTNIVDCDPEQVKVGQPVAVVFHPTQAGPALPRFRPA